MRWGSRSGPGNRNGGTGQVWVDLADRGVENRSVVRLRRGTSGGRGERPDGAQHDRGLWPLGGGVGGGWTGAPLVSPGAIRGRWARSVAESGAAAAPGVLGATGDWRGAGGPGSTPARLPGAARGAPEV